jgi:site-specific recombinase XerD
VEHHVRTVAASADSGVVSATAEALQIGVTLDVAAGVVKAWWAEQVESGAFNARTEAKYQRHLTTFLRYVVAHGVDDVEGITQQLATRWVNAPISAVSPGSRARAGQESSSATRRNRQIALRQVFAVWVRQGWMSSDLVAGTLIKKGPPRPPCPLTPAEVARLRMAGQQSPADTLLPALVAMGLAGVSGTDISRLKVTDVDFEAGVLRVEGRGGRVQRSVELDEPGVRVLRCHVTALAKAAKKRKVEFDPAVTPLALPTAPRTHRSHVDPTAVGQHMYRALHCAGIKRAGVTPGSMQEYAANRCYALTNRVEDVAALLGLKSLDAAMGFIDPAWQQTWADTIRGQQA